MDVSVILGQPILARSYSSCMLLLVVISQFPHCNLNRFPIVGALLV